MTARFDMALLANQDALRRLLERADVEAVQLEKPTSVDQPVCVGVKPVGGKFGWFFGATLLEALELAAQKTRPGVVI
jgi:hypothetical protein